MHDHRNAGSGKRVQSSPKAAQSEPKRSGESVGGQCSDPSGLGDRKAFSPRHDTATALADPVPSRAIIEVYGQAEIAFRDNGWVNATHMAAAFGRKPNDFMRLPATGAYLDALAKDLGEMRDNLAITARGVTGGTWMHPDLALEFARWLSPEFSIWCNRTVRRILQGGAPLGVDLAGVARVLDRVVASHEQLVATQMRMLDRLAALEAPPPPPPAPPALPALAPTLEVHFATICAATVQFPRVQSLVHPVELARTATDRRMFAELVSDPSDYLQVSRFMRFFQGRGFFNRWLKGGSFEVFVEPIGRNRHRRYSITVKNGGES